jgi:hypothetical protein
MKNAFKNGSLFIGVFAVLTAACFGQSTVQRVPDCAVRTYIFTTTGVTADVDNTATNCNTWKMDYTAVGFSAISMQFEAAPAATIAGSGAVTPGTYVAWGGTITNGVNPVIISPGAGSTRFTDTSSSSTQGYFAAFVRVNLSSITGTGTVKVSIYGWRGAADPNTTGGGSGTGCPNPCPVIGPDAVGAAPTHPPVQLGSFDGADVRRVVSDVQGRLLDGAYPLSAAVTVSSSGLTQIIAASAGKITTISHFDIGFASALNWSLQYGTGANCGTGTTAITGTYQNVSGYAIDKPFLVPASQAVCLDLGSSVAGGGFVIYNQQ